MRRFFLSLLSVVAIVPLVRAEVFLPSILGNHAVLQRDKPIHVWGWADPGEKITVTFAGQSASTQANKQGKWSVKLPKQSANAKAQTMTIEGSNKITLNDLLIGDVWVGSGQSNMEWPMIATEKAKERIEAAKHPNLRLFHVHKVQTSVPLQDVPVVNLRSSWKASTPESVRDFSAVLYYFGVELQKELDVPIGLINSSWGGSPIEQWIKTSKSSGQMHNGMIAPILNLPIRGVIWYQGESNAFSRDGMAYRTKMENLIKGWRQYWGNDLPFYYVQIAPWQPNNGGYPGEELQKLWEAQVASLKIPHTGMAVTTDLVDDLKDIHPRNKLDVGKRLALWAFAKTYGKKDLVYSGPLYESMKVEGNKIRLSFAHVGGGLASRDGKPLTSFEIAGEDGKFVPAEAVIEGNAWIVVSSDKVSNPTQVRFGWSNVANPNLTNKEGLPASPFRTKNWQGGTGK